ncbi:hypothetical protein AO058_08315 [Salegentibacter sp. T436]|nr:hypothetical protein AO058_08315 [Salegentibacter sp. T436]
MGIFSTKLICLKKDGYLILLVFLKENRVFRKYLFLQNFYRFKMNPKIKGTIGWSNIKKKLI